MEDYADRGAHWISVVLIRLVSLKIGWWVFGLEGWCGLPLPWGAALFFAIATIPPRTLVNNLSSIVPPYALNQRRAGSNPRNSPTRPPRAS